MDIKEKVKEVLREQDRVNLIIAGTTCSGKTTLAKEIREYFWNWNKYITTIVEQDNYFKNLADIPRVQEGYLTDSIEAFYTEEFKYNIAILQRYGTVKMPIYDISTNTRKSKKRVMIRDINIFEGLHTIHLLNDLEDSIKIYIDTDINTCLQRRIARDTSKYGIPEKTIREYWSNCILPMCEKYIFPQKEMADIIIN